MTEKVVANPSKALLKDIANQIKASANVETLFGESRQIGDRTIIPVARVSYGFGAGGGEGTSPKDAGTGVRPIGSGGGGGGGVSASPVGFIVVTEEGTEFVRIRYWKNAIIAGIVGVVFGFIVAKLLS